MKIRPVGLFALSPLLLSIGSAPILLTPALSAAAPEQIVLRECLAIRSVGRYGRSAIQTDALQAQIVAGRWSPPQAGDKRTLPDGNERVWEAVQAGEDGWFQHPAMQGGYAYLAVPSDSERVMILEAAGHNMVYVNGEPRAGDPYQYGYMRLPIRLRAGRNELIFHCGRGRLRVQMTAPKAEAQLDTGDMTLPDLRMGEKSPGMGALIVLNAAAEPMTGLFLVTVRPDGKEARTPVPAIPAYGMRKVGFRLAGGAPKAPGEEKITVRLMGQRRVLDTTEISLRVRRPNETYKRTFVSEIDGSVQYYAVNPAQPIAGMETNGAAPALFLTLHGASVEAIGQADAYSSKSWGHLVAPTNRRPYGFDWEDWGRLDALEVLSLAQKELRTALDRVYLTGHSMGGHGTWHLGVTFPDRFAAIGPSAGWVSFFSYAGASRAENPSPLQAMLQRATLPSDTLALARNYALHGVYILHGDADDNVPVTEARAMKAALTPFHRDLSYYEQPGAGHWWENSDEPGAECVDWSPMFDLFARRRLPALDSVRELEFFTSSPGVSAWCRWAGILQQQQPFRISSVKLRYDPWKRRFSGTTGNVALLALRLDHVRLDAPILLEIDGQKLECRAAPVASGKSPAAPILYLQRQGETWSVAAPPAPAHKGPHRYGPFKDAFRHRMLFVYGTKGTPEENAWAAAKARYDAETFRYRGNGSIDIIPDTAFDPGKERDRSVILYGHAETNAAWSLLLADSPVQVRRGSVRIGEREERGDDLACLFVRPRPGSDVASVGVVCGSSIRGMRLTDRLPYFISGVAYPDCTVLGAETLTKGVEGVRAVGFFGMDWGVPTGEWVWNLKSESAGANR
jgi:dienelactone hydrolase